jgi:hypothetical protein
MFIDLVFSLLLAASVWLFNGDADELKENAAAESNKSKVVVLRLELLFPLKNKKKHILEHTKL